MEQKTPMPLKNFKTREFNLSGLNGISDQTLEVHFGLYKGYVEHTNLLYEKIAESVQKKETDPEKNPAFAEFKKRLGFEHNGMHLHELYFENLTSKGLGDAPADSDFVKRVKESFGSFMAWKTDFMGTGKMRGIGWVICAEDSHTQRISNHWITLHDQNHIVCSKPLLVMDVWEHAYLLDYKPADRDQYIEAFISNIDWKAVDARLKAKPVSSNSEQK